MRKVLAIIAVLLLPLLVWAQDTAELSQQVEDDKGFITRFLEKNLSGAGRQVLITGFEGALSSRATFAELTVADQDGVWITLRDGAIQWNRSALLRRRIEIAELSAREILLPRMPGGQQQRTAETREFALPDLPVAVNIDKILAERVELGEPVIGLPATVSVSGKMNLENGEGVTTLAIDRLDGPRGRFALDAGFSNATKVLKLDLKLDEDKDGLLVNLIDLHDRPAVSAEISGEGPTSDFLADISLATDGQPRVTGKASATARAAADGTPGTAFRLELGGDIASLLPPDDRTFFGSNTQLLAEGWRGEDKRLEVPVLMIDTNALNLSGSLTTNAAGAPQQAVLLMTLGADAGATDLPVKLPFGDARVNDGRLSLQYDAAQGSGWQLTGRIGQLARPGMTIGALELDGSGQVALNGERLDEITGKLTFGGKALAFDDAGLAQAVGEAITGSTDFSYAPDNAAELANLTVTGADYGLGGNMLLSGLSGGVTVSGWLDARYDDLARLSTLAGRPMTGRADARIEGLYQVLTRSFDVDVALTGNDVTLDQAQLDRLLAGQSTVSLMARRDETGIQLSGFDLRAQRLTATAEGFLNSNSSDLRARISMPSLTEADAELGGSLEAEAFVNGPSGQRRLTISGQAQDLQTGIRELDGALKGATSLTAIAAEKDGGYLVEQFRLANPQIAAEGQGELSAGQTNADITLKVPDLSAFGRGWKGSLNATAGLRDQPEGGRRVTIEGTGQDLSLGQAQADGALKGTTRLSLRGVQDGDRFTIDEARIVNDQALVEARGRYAPKDTDLTAHVDIRDLGLLGLGWRGSLAADASLADDGSDVRRLTLEGTGQDLALGQHNVDGALTGTTRIALRATQQGDSFTIEDATILNDQARIEAAGRYAPAGTDLTATIDVKRLESLGLGWRGSFAADATFKDDGSGARRLSVDGTGTDLALGQAQVDAALSAATRLSLRGIERDGVFTIEDAQIDNARLTASAAGQVGKGATDLTARLNAGDLRFLGRGLAGAIAAEGRLTEQGGVRRITASGTGTGLRTGQDRLDPLLAGQTRFDIAATQEGQALSLQRLDIQNPRLQVTADGNPQAGLNVDARLADLGLIEPRFPGPATARGTLRETDTDFVVDLAVTAPGDTVARISGRAARNLSDVDIAASGNSDAALANPFIRTRSIEGPLTFDLRMNGRPSLQALSGRLQLTGGELAEPKLGLRLEALNITADINGERIAVNGAGNVSDGGRITLSGPIDLSGGTVDIGVTLDQVTLRDPNLYEATIDGALRFSGVQSQGPTISGRIAIDRAELRIPSTGLGGAKAIPDITHVGSQRPPVRATRAKAGLAPFPSADAIAAGMRGPAATPPVNPPKLDLVIDAPNQIFVRGRGVDAEMGGRIELRGTTRNVMPIGTLDLIRGRVDLLGKRFTLTEGRIELQGSLVPVIRLVAETAEGEITTRIVIDGDARNPDISFESSPDLPEEEVLSQLLFGRGLDKISPLQAAQLANAVAVLAGRGGEGIVSKLRNSVGLDELDLATDDEGNVQVRAGKYLSKNLYTDVSVGNDGKTKLNLNLDINPALRARGSVGSDGESSIGVFFEKDY